MINRLRSIVFTQFQFANHRPVRALSVRSCVPAVNFKCANLIFDASPFAILGRSSPRSHPVVAYVPIDTLLFKSGLRRIPSRVLAACRGILGQLFPTNSATVGLIGRTCRKLHFCEEHAAIVSAFVSPSRTVSHNYSTTIGRNCQFARKSESMVEVQSSLQRRVNNVYRKHVAVSGRSASIVGTRKSPA